MGWTSYLEDITERLANDLRTVETVLSDATLPEPAKVNALIEWHGRAKRVLLELQRDMDLATDPDLDLPAQIRELEKRRGEILADNHRLQEERRRQQQDVDEASKSIHALHAQMAEMKESVQREKKRNDKLQKVLETDPSPLYEKYTTPERLKRFAKDDD